LARRGRPLSDYATIAKDWNANTVRIGVAPPTWKRTDHAAVMKQLKQEVDAALRSGMFVMIDWHTIGWPNGYYETPDWAGGLTDLYDSDFELGLSFWKACARAFGKDGRVAFHLWCEPVLKEDDWETKPGSTWSSLRPWFVKLTSAIRAEGAGNLVLATGNRWAYDLIGIRANPLPDKNTAYMWHVYGGHDDNKPAMWAKALDNLYKVAPVVVSEWGFDAETKEHFKGTEAAFGRPFLKFMEDRGLHWTAWCWHPTWGPTLLQNDWKSPTPYGGFVKTALGKLNKNPTRP